jgi:hypothetical protein
MPAEIRGAGMKIGRLRLIVALALGLFMGSLSAAPQQPTGIP